MLTRPTTHLLEEEAESLRVSDRHQVETQAVLNDWAHTAASWHSHQFYKIFFEGKSRSQETSLMSSCDLNFYNFWWSDTSWKSFFSIPWSLSRWRIKIDLINFALLSVLCLNNFLPALHSIPPNCCKTSFACSPWRQYKSGRYLRTQKKDYMGIWQLWKHLNHVTDKFFCKVIAQSLNYFGNRSRGALDIVGGPKSWWTKKMIRGYQTSEGGKVY